MKNNFYWFIAVAKYIVLVTFVSLFSFSANSTTTAPVKESVSENLNKLTPEKSSELLMQVMGYIAKEYVEPIENGKIIQGALDGMLSRIDPHSGYLNPVEYQKFCEHTKGEFGGLGMELTIVNNLPTIIAVIDDTPAAKAGLKSKDNILAVNGTPIVGLTLSDSVEMMRGKPGTSVTLLIKRDGEKKPFPVIITRQIIVVKSVKARMEKDVGYIRIATFDEKTTDLLEKAIMNFKKDKNLKGIVIDLRDNPGGLLSQAISAVNLFIDNGVIVTTKRRRAEFNEDAKAIAGNAIIGDVPIVVLINEGSASAAEIMAGALQDHNRALIMGETSFGKGSVQTLLPLSKGDGGIKLTIARFYTPLGHPIQGNGIKPDVVVEQLKGMVAEKPPFPSIKEKDLHGSLANEKLEKPLSENQKDVDTKSNIALPKDEKNKEKSLTPLPNDSSNAESLPIDDYQLFRALETVKLMHLLRSEKKGLTLPKARH